MEVTKCWILKGFPDSRCHVVGIDSRFNRTPSLSGRWDFRSGTIIKCDFQYKAKWIDEVKSSCGCKATCIILDNGTIILL